MGCSPWGHEELDVTERLSSSSSCCSDLQRVVCTRAEYRGSRISLVVQWLKICLAMQGHLFDPSSGKIPHAVGQ